MIETWKKIPDFPGYEVSNHGKVRSFWLRIRKQGIGCGRGNIPSVISQDVQLVMKPTIDRLGYHRYVILDSNKEYRNRGIGRLMLSAFVGQCPKGFVARHLDGDPSNNHLSNLEWSSQADNLADCLIHGTRIHGEKHYRAKIKERDVLEIRHLHSVGMTMSDIARVFPITRKAVSFIISRRTWKHIP